MSLSIYFKKLSPTAKAPTFSVLGYKLYACEKTIIPSKSMTRVRTGIAAMLNNKHFVMRICACTSPFAEHNLLVCDDILPSTMTDEITVVIRNESELPLHVQRGANIAQLLITELLQPEVNVIEYEAPRDSDEDMDAIPSNQWAALEEGYISWPEFGYVAWRDWNPQPHSTIITIDSSDDNEDAAICNACSNV